jgi:DNA (cytosine-5)-methyltransferase 1
LVARLFDFLRQACERGRPPRWLVIENVPYMLHLDRGRAMREMVHELEGLGFRWAYRIIDARGFGVPQRRRRVVLVASPTEDPRTVLFAGNHEETVDDSTSIVDRSIAYGFYWTEGKRGLGWGVDAVPTIKGGSTIGIPSPPAIWIPMTGEVGTPDIRDLERLQGFPEDWTAAAETVLGRAGRNSRWKLIGNAVNVEVAKWVAERLVACDGPALEGRLMRASERWPDAAWGEPGSPPRVVCLSAWPVAADRIPLRAFLRHPLKPLSRRAATGYLARTAQATALNFTPGFLEAMSMHERRMIALDADLREAA